jgi:competence protein ComGC
MAREQSLNLRRAFSLVEILVVGIIIIALAAWLFPKFLSSTKNAAGKTIDSPIQRAKGVECSNNLQQIRQSLQIAGMSEERPQSLQELRGIPASMFRCPIGGEDYRFDPQSQKVMCPRPGHESL